MSKRNIEEVKSMQELAKSLSTQNVKLLQEILAIPSAIVESTGTKQIDFLNSLKFDFVEFNPFNFVEALKTIERTDLIPIATKIPWINKGTSERIEKTRESTSTESFVALLRAEVETDQWKLIIGGGLSERVKSKLDFDTAFRLCVESGLITKDLGDLCEMMIAVERHDIIENIHQHLTVFEGMNETELKTKLLEELETDTTQDYVNWIMKLQEYTKQQHERVYIHFDDQEAVALESVYTFNHCRGRIYESKSE